MPKKKPAKSSAPKTSKSDVLTTLLSSLAPITNEARAAFRSLVTDARCESFGGRTQSILVEREALDWAATIARTLSKPGVRVRYSAARLVWLLECVAALREARAHQSAKQGKTTALGATRAAAMEKAKQVRADLVDALERLAGDDHAQTAAIARDAGDHRTTEAPDTLADALDALATRVEDWCGRKDERAKTLVASVDLLPGDAAVARATAVTLRSAATDKTLEGRGTAHDTPPTNRIEGRVLFEMKEAMQAFAAANAKNTDVPKLVPGPGTRQVLATRAPTKAAAPAPTPPAPTDGASTTTHA